MVYNVGMKVDLGFVRGELGRLAQGNEEYALFNGRIVNTAKAVVGVRTPDMRRLAKSLARGVGFEELMLMFDEIDGGVYEEVLLAGFVVNYAKLTDVERLELTKVYLSFVDSWALVDNFVEKLRRKYDRELWWDYSLLCLKSDKEFVVRYGVVNLMSNYLDDEYLVRSLTEVRDVRHEGYYVKMGLAWLYATAAVRDFELVMGELASHCDDDWVRRKAYTKMLESFRMSDEQKVIIRGERAKIKK